MDDFPLDKPRIPDPPKRRRPDHRPADTDLDTLKTTADDDDSPNTPNTPNTPVTPKGQDSHRWRGDSPMLLETGDLTTRQHLFVEAYLGEAKGIASHAARAAGFNGSPNVLATTGRDLLRHPRVAARIQSRLNEVGMSTTAILHELAEVALAPTSHFMIQTQEELFDKDGRKVRDAAYRQDYGAKMRALELLMRYHRMLDERQPVEVTTKVLIGVDINRI